MPRPFNRIACVLAVAAPVLLATVGPVAAQARFRDTYDSIRVSSSYSVLNVVENARGGFAAAGGNGAAFLLELDADGVTNFFKTYNIFSAPGLDVVAGVPGGYVLAGEHLSFNDPTILRVDATGEPLWAKSYDLGYSEQGFYVVHPTPDGGYLASGIQTAKVDPTGVVQWSKIHIGGGGNVNGTEITADGGSVLTGEGQYGTAGIDYNAVVTRIDPSGINLWNKVYAGDEYDWSAGVTETLDGGFAVTGWTRSFGPRACFLIRLDADGVLQWANTYSGTTDSECRGVDEADGGFVLTGALDGDLLLLRTDARGDLEWARTYDGSNIGYAVRATSDLGYVVAGVSGGSLTILKTDASGDAATCDQLTPAVTVAAAPFRTGTNTTDGPTTWTPNTLAPSATAPIPPVVRVCASCTAIASAQVSDIEVCAGESVTLTAFGSSVTDCTVTPEYRWRAPGFLRDWSTIPDATDTPVVTTDYTLDVRCSDPGCQAVSAPVTVTVGASPQVDPGADTTICVGETTTIGGAPTAFDGTPPYDYDWVAAPPDPSLSCASGPACGNPDATPTATTTYTVTVTDSLGCSATAATTVIVDVPAAPPDVGNTVMVVKDLLGPPPAPDSILFTWLDAGGSAEVYFLRSSDNRDFSPPNGIRTSALPGFPARLGGEVPSGPPLRLYRVTSGNCAGDESPF